MPKYSKSDIRYTIREDDFRRIIKSTKLLRDRLFLCLLYCTGARPSEISGDPQRGLKGMTIGDIVYDLGKGEITFKVPISKLKKDEYGQEKRILTLEFDPNNIDLPIRLIINWLNRQYKRFQKTGETKLDQQIFDFTRRTGYNIVSRASKVIGVQICPYNFRHSRLTQLAEQGAGIETLMYFKGSKDIKSIQPYLHAKAVKFKLKREDET